MDSIEKLREKLLSSRPQDWQAIPDIDLYMDQVIGYMTRQHIGLELEDEESLTPAMINNYIKSGLLPRANGKKYDRTHIGYLTAICLLKQVLTVGETGTLLAHQMARHDIEQFYESYGKVLDGEYSRLAQELKKDRSEEELAQLALQLAVSGYARTLACKTILREITGEKEESHG